MISIEKLPKSQVKISFSVPWKEWEKKIDAAFGAIAAKMKIDGFRAGKAPRSLVEQKVGRAAIIEEAADRAIQSEWKRTIEEKKVDAIGKPSADIMKIAEGNDLEFSITASVMPETAMKRRWEKEIKKVNEEHRARTVDVSDEEVAKELERLAKSRAKFVTVNREAKEGDSARLDFRVARGGVPIEGGTASDFVLLLGSGAFIPGFEENIVGMKGDEEKVFSLVFPPDYHEKSLAGKEAEFQVKVRAVEERNIPEINDEFASLLGNFSDLAALKKSIADGMEREKREKQKDEHRNALAGVLAQFLEADLPDSMIEGEMERMVATLEHNLALSGSSLEKILEMSKKTREEMEKEWIPNAEARVRTHLAIAEIAKDRDMHPTAEEMEAEMNKALAQFGGIEKAKKEVDMERLYAAARETLVSEKVFSYVEGL